MTMLENGRKKKLVQARDLLREICVRLCLRVSVRIVSVIYKILLRISVSKREETLCNETLHV